MEYHTIHIVVGEIRPEVDGNYSNHELAFGKRVGDGSILLDGGNRGASMTAEA